MIKAFIIPFETPVFFVVTVFFEQTTAVYSFFLQTILCIVDFCNELRSVLVLEPSPQVFLEARRSQYTLRENIFCKCIVFFSSFRPVTE